jgi:hypothetical protein
MPQLDAFVKKSNDFNNLIKYVMTGTASFYDSHHSQQ